MAHFVEIFSHNVHQKRVTHKFAICQKVILFSLTIKIFINITRRTNKRLFGNAVVWKINCLQPWVPKQKCDF